MKDGVSRTAAQSARSRSGRKAGAAAQLHMVWPPGREPPRVRTPRGYLVRPLRDGEEEALARLMTRAGFRDWDAEKAARWRVHALPKGWLVAEHRATGALAASALAAHRPDPLHPEGGELGWVATDPGHSRKGLGTAVCAGVVRRFWKAGYERIYLKTDDWRTAAIRLYLKLGFLPLCADPGARRRWRRLGREFEIPSAGARRPTAGAARR